MSHAANLWLYFLVVFGVVVLPGMDMAFVMGSSLVGGRRAGFAAVAGIVAGGVCHMVMTATGISVLLTLWPAAMSLMLLAGAAYVAWIGFSLLRVSSMTGPQAVTDARTMGASFRRAMLTNLLNPKAYVFMLAVFPQFVRAEQGPMWMQASELWVITALTQAGVYGGLAVAAARTRGWLAANPQANVLLARLVGALLLGVAVVTAWSGWVRG